MSLLTLLGITIVALSLLLALIFFRTFARSYGKRVITCPENGAPAGVSVAAFSAALKALSGEESMKLGSCTRWPEREGCGQECLREIRNAPDGCLVHARLTQWYEGKHCHRCKQDVSPSTWGINRPALAAPDGKTYAWSEIPIEKIPEVLRTHVPVCSNCHVVSALIVRFPDRVLIRDRRQPGS